MLTARQQKFCEQYLIDLNGTQSAIRAGYSPKTANRIANENLTKPDIQKKISLLQIEAREQAGITKQEVINTLSDIIKANIADLFQDSGIKPVNELSDIQKKCIESIKIYKGKTEIKLFNKLVAIERINKMMGWDLPEKTESELKIIWEEKRYAIDQETK
ncbi:MAG: phage terminase small [Prolixibacteraceae bacterium]|nr:MAG: phage terminase small [Prolixibacteraceae bacterium]